MTTVSDRPRGRLRQVLPTALFVKGLTIWQVVHAGLVLVGLGLVLSGQTTGAFRAGLLFGLALLLAGDAIAIRGLVQRRESGRMAAIIINYLTFFGAASVLLQTTDVFRGIDALAATFARGVPFLIVALLAYLAGGLQRFARPARIVALVALLGAAVAVGLLPGLVTFVSRLAAPLPLAMLLLAVIGLVAALRLSHSDVGRHLNATTKGDLTIDGLLFVSPNVLGFLAFFAGPLLFSLWMSFNNWDAFATPEFIGIDNYVRIFSLTVTTAETGQTGADVLRTGYQELTRIGNVVIGAQDPLFWRSLMNIIIFAALAIPLSVVPALFLATLLNADVPGIKVFRALYFVPSIAGVVAVALIWKQLFNSTVGWINYLIDRGAAVWNALPVLPEVTAGQPQWLSDNSLALLSLVIVFAWQYVGFNTVLFLAGLQSVDPTLYEAAQIDGATRWQRFRYITIPQLSSTTFFVIASTGILALQLFGEAVVLFPSFTPIGAGPQNSTLTPVVYLYDQGFRRFAQGYASAIAWVLFLLIFAFTFVQFQRQRAEVEGA